MNQHHPMPFLAFQGRRRSMLRAMLRDCIPPLSATIPLYLTFIVAFIMGIVADRVF